LFIALKNQSDIYVTTPLLAFYLFLANATLVTSYASGDHILSAAFQAPDISMPGWAEAIYFFIAGSLASRTNKLFLTQICLKPAVIHNISMITLKSQDFGHD
jgi:uncharacterized membrane protein